MLRSNSVPNAPYRVPNEPFRLGRQQLALLEEGRPRMLWRSYLTSGGVQAVIGLTIVGLVGGCGNADRKHATETWLFKPIGTYRMVTGPSDATVISLAEGEVLIVWSLNRAGDDSTHFAVTCGIRLGSGIRSVA